MKDIQNNNVTIQLSAKDLSGRNLRISDCDVFIIRVFTESPDNYISFTGRDFLSTEFVDEITISRRDMEQLRSGVVQYTYHYLPKSFNEDIPNYIDSNVEMSLHHLHHHHPHHTHRPDDYCNEQLINSKPVVTSIYWRNLKPFKNPHFEHGCNMDEVARLHHLIDVETFNRIKDVDNLKEEDKRLETLLNELQEKADEIIDNADSNNEEVENKLNDNIKAIEELTLKFKKRS